MTEPTPKEQVREIIEQAVQQTELLPVTSNDMSQAAQEFFSEITLDVREKRKWREIIGKVVSVLCVIYIWFFPLGYIACKVFKISIETEIVVQFLKTVPWAFGLLAVIVIFYHPSKAIEKVVEQLAFWKKS